jgi:hypothetical protein
MRLKEELSLLNRRELAAKMRTWKWLFVGIDECDGLICIEMGITEKMCIAGLC